MKLRRMYLLPIVFLNFFPVTWNLTVKYKSENTLAIVGQLGVFNCGRACNDNPECSAFQYNHANNLCTFILMSNEILQINSAVGNVFYQLKDCKSDGYQYFWHHDTCIKAVIETRSWEDAEAYCQQEGGHMVSLENPDKELLLIEILKTHYVTTGTQIWWVGATDTETEGQFKWTNGREFNFTNWANKQPNNKGVVSDPVFGADCLLVQYKDGNDKFLWYDRGCLSLEQFVCEHRLFL